jgi:hypothetical protein
LLAHYQCSKYDAVTYGKITTTRSARKNGTYSTVRRKGTTWRRKSVIMQIRVDVEFSRSDYNEDADDNNDEEQQICWICVQLEQWTGWS